MKLIQWTVFIDMLGYRNINGEISNEKTAREFISFMEENKKIILDADNNDTKEFYYKERDAFDLYEYYDISSCFVSDSIIITFKPKEVEKLNNSDLRYRHSANALFIILFRINKLIINCLEKKEILLRGGISTKYAHIKDGFAVGEGVIESYTVESSVAKYPRIAIHQSIANNIELIKNIKSLSRIMYGNIPLIKKCPSDRVSFINVIGYEIAGSTTRSLAVLNAAKESPELVAGLKNNTIKNLQTHRNIIIKKIKDEESNLKDHRRKKDEDKIKASEKILGKIYWLKDYFNQCINEYDESKEYREYLIP